MSHALFHIGERSVRLELPTDGAVTGRLAFADGTVPAGAVVGGSWARASVSLDGSFHLEGVPSGDRRVWFDGPDFTPFSLPDIEIRPGATIDVGLVTAAHSRTLTGRVVDRSGAPVGGAKIDVGVMRPEPAEPDDPPGGFHAHRSAEAAADGAFRVYHVPPTPMIAIASAPGAGSSAPAAIPDVHTAPGDPPPVTLVLPGEVPR